MSDCSNNLPPGTFLRGNTYRIARFIAAGGFGCTYEAEHVLLEKRVAIKEFFMQEYCNRDAETNRVTVGTQSMHEMVDKYKRKFIGEAKALCGLHNEGVVSVSDVFEEHGTAYFVMDYIEGQSLGSLCKNGPLPEAHALYYIRQVCEALAYVHDHNRLHLDIKPGNIMTKPDGTIVLIDFGASKQYDAASGENNSSILGFTLGYAPLEQMNGNVQQFYPATDIYALGATLYCLLTGQTPKSPAVRLNEEEDLFFPAGISPTTRHAVEQAMQVRKKDRPQSVQEFVALLNAKTVQNLYKIYPTTNKVEINFFSGPFGNQWGYNATITKDQIKIISGTRRTIQPLSSAQYHEFLLSLKSLNLKIRNNVIPEDKFEASEPPAKLSITLYDSVNFVYAIYWISGWRSQYGNIIGDTHSIYDRLMKLTPHLHEFHSSATKKENKSLKTQPGVNSNDVSNITYRWWGIFVLIFEVAFSWLMLTQSREISLNSDRAIQMALLLGACISALIGIICNVKKFSRKKWRTLTIISTMAFLVNSSLLPIWNGSLTGAYFAFSIGLSLISSFTFFIKK